MHFEISCMIWVLVGALGIAISEEFALSATQKGFLVAIPMLGGAFLRIIIGPLADHYGPKTIGLFVLLFEFVALMIGWLRASDYSMMFCIGMLLGFAGASFAIALPIASHAYPPAYQGLAMGVAAVGNSGVLLAMFLAPRLANLFGWRNTFGLMAIPTIITAVIFWLTVPSRTSYVSSRRSGVLSIFRLLRNALRQKFMYWLCFLYGVTFGGFVGFSSFLPIFFHDEYHIDMIRAGTMTAVCGLAGSVARPIGGYIADRYGGVLLLQRLFPVLSIFCVGLAQLSSATWVFPTLVMVLVLLGFGNGVVFQVAATRFRDVMGTASGLIGAAGALGGFLLPSWFGILKDTTDTFASGFWVFAAIAGLAALSVFLVQRSHRVSMQTSI